MFGFHVGEAREHGAHAEVGRFASIDAGEERIGEQVNHLRSVVTLDHLGHGFVGFGLMRRMEPLGGHAHFGAKREKRREHRRQNLGRHHEHEAVGHDDELVLDHDIGFAVGVVRADELVAQSDFAAEVGGPGFFGEEGIGTGFHEAPVFFNAVGDHDSAEARSGFEENVVDL